MIPQQLQTKCDFVLQEMGGVEVALEFIDEKEIIETCTFGGPVFVMSPYTTNSVVSATNGSLGSYDSSFDYSFEVLSKLSAIGSIENFNRELYDLTLFGYRSNSYYRVLDSNMVEIYKAICRPIRVNGVKSHYFGLNEPDMLLLEEVPHGTILYLQFAGERSPVLIKIVVNKKPNPQKYTEYLISLARSISTMKVVKDKEALLQLPEEAINPEVYVLPRSLQYNPKMQKVYNNRDSYKYRAQSNNELYLRVTEDIWIAARDVIPDLEAFPEIQYINIKGALTKLEDSGFSFIDKEERIDIETTRNDTLIFYKDLGNNTLSEMVLEIGRDGMVETVKQCTYKPMTFTNIEGYGTEYTWGVNNKTLNISTKESARHPSIHSSHKLGQVKLTRNKQPVQCKLSISLSL